VDRRAGVPAAKLAAFTLVSLALTGLVAVTIAPSAFSRTHTYRAEFTDVTSLVPGDDVRIAGVRVGTIHALRIVRGSTAEVTFTVARDVRIATGVRAKIRYLDLAGQRYLALTDGAGDGNRLTDNGLIPLAHTQPALDLTVLLNGFRPLFQALDPDDVNRLALQIVQVLQGEPGTVASLLTHTASLTQALAARDEAAGQVITNLNALLGAIEDRDGQLSGLIGELQRLVSALAADSGAIGASLTSLSGLTGATAGLLDEGRPAVQADIAGLGKVAGTLAGSQGLVEGVLTRLPAKLGTLTSAASSGGWVDLYLCQLGGGRPC
jgi:phospholipid/cholesterol/gamma-HCH transport system substrate-binding protein